MDVFYAILSSIHFRKEGHALININLNNTKAPGTNWRIAQLDQPSKVSFEINAIKVFDLL